MKTMKMTNKFFTLVALVATMMISSCSSNNNDDELPQDELSEEVMQDFVNNINGMAIPSTLSNSNNPYAQQANAQFNAVKGIGVSFASLFTVPANAISAKTAGRKAAKGTALSSKTYTWSVEGTTVKYTITENSDRYTFTYDITSSEFTGKIMDGYQLKDGSYAEANLFEDSTVVTTIKWWVNNDISKIEINADGSRLVLESNTKDNSGNLKVYESSTLIGLYEWNADGSGKFVDYLEDETYTW